MQLEEKLIMDLSEPLVKTIKEFYKDPLHQANYKEWHLKKYGCLPEEQVIYD